MGKKLLNQSVKIYNAQNHKGDINYTVHYDEFGTQTKY